MTKSKFFLTLLTLLTFSVGTIWAKDYSLMLTLDFSSVAATGTTSTALDNAALLTLLQSAASATTDITAASKTSGDVYNGKGSGGSGIPNEVLKIGKASGSGAISFTIASTYSDVSKVEIIGYGWKTTTAVSVNGSDAQSPATALVKDTFSYELSTASKTIAISSASSAFCVTHIKLYKDATPKPTVTLSEKQLNWGMVKHDVAQTPKTFTITGANLTGTDPLTVTVVPTGSPFSYSVTDGSLTPSAGAVSATITVSASTENAGSYADGTYYIKVNGGGLGADTATVATYMEVGYQITMAVNDDAMGTATVSDAFVSNQSTLIALADNVGIKAEANVGYKFDNWTISPDDGVDINSTTLPEALISEVFKDVTITANFSVDACTQLAVPTLVSATSTYNSVTLIWDAVENADRYEVKIWTTDESSALIEPVTPNPPEELTVTFTGLEVETEYNYSIMAVGSSTYCENNNKLTGTVTTAAYPDATLTLSENGVERPWGSSLKVNSQIALPTEAVVGLSGKVLVGWSSVEIPTASDKPTSNYFELGANYTVAKPADKLYAVYATEAPSTATYTLNYTADVASKTLGYGTKVNVTATDGSAWVVKAAKNSGMQINKSKDASIKIPDCSGDIKSIAITCNDAAKNAVGLSASDYSGSGTITYIAYAPSNSTSQTIDLSGKSNVKGGYIVPKEGNCQITNIVVTYVGPSTYSNYITTGVATLPAPTFTVDEEEFVSSMNVGLSTTVDGATIYYQFETTPIPGDPMSEGIEYTAPVEITSTTIVYAYVAKGGIYSEVVYKTYTGIPTYDCENFVALTEGNKAALGEVVVTYVNGKSFWVKDNSGAFQIYDASGTFTLQAGDVVNGVVGTRSAYQTVPQVAPTVAFSALTVTPGAAPDPVELSGVPAEADFNKYVVLKGVTFATAGAFTTSGSETISAIFNTSPFTLFNKFKLAQSFADDKAYDVVGVVSYYETGSLVQLYFISATESTTTAIDNTIVEGKAVKAIENGQLVIIKNGVKYNIIGAQLR